MNSILWINPILHILDLLLYMAYKKDRFPIAFQQNKKYFGCITVILHVYKHRTKTIKIKFIEQLQTKDDNKIVMLLLINVHRPIY